MGRRDSVQLKSVQKALLLGLLFALLFGLTTPASAIFGINKASKSVRGAIETMSATAAALPKEMQEVVSAHIAQVAHESNQILDRIDSQTVPIVNDAVADDLDHISDIVMEITHNLKQMETQGIKQINADVTQRIAQLQSLVSADLDQINSMVDNWIEKTKTSVIQVEERAGTVLVKSASRLTYDAVRLGAVALFLIGLFVTGAMMMRFLPHQTHWWAVIKQNLLVFVIGVGFLLTFFGSSLALSLRPDLLASLSADIERHHPSTPCDRFARGQKNLKPSVRRDHPGLAARIDERMKRLRDECFGLADRPRNDDRADLSQGSTASPQELEQIQTQMKAAREEFAKLISEKEKAQTELTRLKREIGTLKDETSVPIQQYVTLKDVNVHSSPGLDAEKVAVLTKGTRIKVLERAEGGQWLKIQRDGKELGYVYAPLIGPAE